MTDLNQFSHHPRDILDRYRQCVSDPWYFLKNCVFTLDQVDKLHPIKPFPAHYDYLKLYVRGWQKRRLIVVPKSRRMFMSWCNIGLYLWDTMFGIGRTNIFQSKKEESSNNLIERAKFVLEHIPPEFIPPDMIPKWDKTYCNLKFPELHSEILGVAQGESQLREHTASGLLFDEFAFWDEAEDTYGAAMPTIEGGGRCTILSSAQAGAFMEKIVFDTLQSHEEKEAGTQLKQVSETLRKFPIEGLEVWTNPRNQFTVFQLHFTANPLKRSEQWKRHTRSNLTAKKWQQEYEISWESVAGKPVYNDFVKKIHGKTKLTPEPGLPLLRGWDFGLTPACVIAQLQGSQMVVLREFIGVNMGIERFARDVVLPGCRLLYPEWSDRQNDWLDFIDPAGLAKSQTDESTCAQHMAAAGIVRINPGAIDWESRRSSVEHFLTRFVRRDKEVIPCFVIDLEGCPLLVSGFTGGYQYPEKALEIEPEKIRPIKNKFSHPHDGLQYLTSMARNLVRPDYGLQIDIPVPSYNYGQVS